MKMVSAVHNTRKALICAILVILMHNASAQIQDTARLEEIKINAYFSSQPLLKLPSSVTVIDSLQLKNHPEFSLVSAINSAPGIRMEERSPGSYRLSIRGSLLRSPFGIRNVKIYVDGFPLTDAGGNSYLNILSSAGVNRIEVLKGPESSIFGANSGGVVLIDQDAGGPPGVQASATLQAGSYDLNYGKLSVQKNTDNYRMQIGQAFQKSGGYRENSSMERYSLQTGHRWNYSEAGYLRALLIYTDLNYRTPGGLTLAQMNQNPAAARPRAGTTPGAAEQEAGILNKTLMGGISNDLTIKPNLRHVIALFGSKTDFKNPFITNYEVRDEDTYGARTFIELKTPENSNTAIQWQTGLEGSKTSADISNYGNTGGNKGTIQSSDRIIALQYFIFTHLSASISKWMLEGAVSLNNYNYRYNSLLTNSATNKRNFQMQVMPRTALSYPVTDNFWWRASASRGYSPPAIAEVRASDNVINTDLQAENGWNYETGLRYKSSGGRIYADAVVFRYNLKNAIVRRVNPSDQEYFINAGGTKQTGFESQISAILIPENSSGFLRELRINSAYTYSDFLFSDYTVNSTDLSGNKLTGIPEHVVVTGINLNLAKGFYIFGQHNYTTSIPLNDANTVYAKEYQLVQLKGGRKCEGHNSSFDLFAGVDNLFNTKYSLGNDLNAFGGRYFNPSAPRNYYFGITATFK